MNRWHLVAAGSVALGVVVGHLAPSDQSVHHAPRRHPGDPLCSEIRVPSLLASDGLESAGLGIYSKPSMPRSRTVRGERAWPSLDPCSDPDFFGAI